ncbi:MAG: hypothetical protein BroJett018_39420 [Chloroflexota bacterium]|nr:MAG: hypothetical protein BroJett018_39420 [Chloroflexota bacterium]
MAIDWEVLGFLVAVAIANLLVATFVSFILFILIVNYLVRKYPVPNDRIDEFCAELKYFAVNPDHLKHIKLKRRHPVVRPIVMLATVYLLLWILPYPIILLFGIYDMRLDEIIYGSIGVGINGAAMIITVRRARQILLVSQNTTRERSSKP